MTTDVSIRRVADELVVRNLVARLSHLADSGSDDDMTEYISIYTADGAWAPIVPASAESSASRARHGHDDILAGVQERRAAGLQGPGSNSKHFITTMTVAFETDDLAQTRCNFLVYNETNARPPVLYTVGEYRDSFVRTSEGWRLSRREIVPG
jgi:hypothetical protein